MCGTQMAHWQSGSVSMEQYLPVMVFSVTGKEQDVGVVRENSTNLGSL